MSSYLQSPITSYISFDFGHPCLIEKLWSTKNKDRDYAKNPITTSSITFT